ncbi:putative PB1 domain containing protein [Trypanosoma cruzi]|nr:putative PB1 domain containing protein [Trypanosoma cruzi]
MSAKEGAAAKWDECVSPATEACRHFSRPPPYPTPLSAWINRPEEGNVHETATGRHAVEGMREAPVLGYRAKRRDPVYPENSQNCTANALVELECILMYVETVTTSLAQRSRVPIPSESVRVISTSVVTSRRLVNAEQHDGAPQYSLAMGLHDSANSLLGCLAKLEYMSLFQKDELDDIERKVNTTAGDVNIALDAMVLRYTTHELSDVKEFFLGNQPTIEECRRMVHGVSQTAHQILLLRRAVVGRDLALAQKLFSEHQTEYQKKGGVTRLHSPFFTWMGKRWFPAMEAWRRIVAQAHEQAETSDVLSAIARGHQETFSQVDLIGDILLPGETLSDLLRKELDEPFSHLAESLKKTRHHVEALRAAVAKPQVGKLTECVCAVEELVAAGRVRSVADRELLKEGKRLIIRLQQVENVEAALRLAAQVGETVSLFRTINHANEIILQLGIAGDAAATKEIVARCSALLEEMKSSKEIPPAELIARRMDAASITVAHVPSQIWSAKTTVAYQAACQSLVANTAQDLARINLERVLKGGEDCQLNTTGSTFDDASNISLNNHSMRVAAAKGPFPKFKGAQVAELRTALKRANELGLNGQLIQDGEAVLRSVEALKLKVHFDAQLRVVLIANPENATFDEIYKKVSELCSRQEGGGASNSAGRKLRLRYQDSDGDCISLLTQEDWDVFVGEEAPNGVCGAKLELYCDYMQLPHAHVTDTLIETQPAVEEALSSPEKVAVKARVQTCIKETNPRSARATPQRRNVANNGTRFFRSRSAAVGLRHSEFLFRYRTPQRTNFHESRVQKPHKLLDAVAEREDAVNVASIGEPSQTTGQERGGAPAKDALPGTKPGLSGRSRVNSLRLNSSLSSLTNKPKLLIPIYQEKRSRMLTKAAVTASSVAGNCGGGGDTTASTYATTSTNQITPVSTPTPTATSSVVTMPANTNDHKNNEATAAVNTTPSASPPIELETVKKWNDDDAPLELRTVVSTASTSKRAVISVKGGENSVKQLAKKRLGGGFTVTPCSKGIGNSSKAVGTDGVPNSNTPNTAGITVLEEKREWSAEMFMRSDICTVVSEQTNQPPSVTNCVGRQKPTNVTPLINATHVDPAIVPPSNASSVKKKAEVLQQLRHLREENQKALKAALNKRRTGK